MYLHIVKYWAIGRMLLSRLGSLCLWSRYMLGIFMRRARMSHPHSANIRPNILYTKLTNHTASSQYANMAYINPHHTDSNLVVRKHKYHLCSQWILYIQWMHKCRHKFHSPSTNYPDKSCSQLFGCIQHHKPHHRCHIVQYLGCMWYSYHN